MQEPRRKTRLPFTHMILKGLLASHACRTFISYDDLYRKYRQISMRKMLEHLLCFCPALFRTRLKYFGALQFKRLYKMSKLDIESQQALTSCMKYTSVQIKINPHLTLLKIHITFFCEGKSSQLPMLKQKIKTDQWTNIIRLIIYDMR